MHSNLTLWLLAIRPKTLVLAWLAVLLGTSLAVHTSGFNWPVAFFTLTTATLLQILTNLANDYGDALKGVDNQERLGPLRVMQTGLISYQQMRLAIGLVILFTLASGLALIYLAQISLIKVVVFIGLGALAILAALTYTLGNKPYGYLALGDLAVLIFFGWLAVIGSYYLQTQSLALWLFLPATAYGLLAVAVLNINNLRDLDNDLENGKLTFAALIGFNQAKIYQGLLLILALASFALSFIYLTPSLGYLAFAFSLFIVWLHLKKLIKINKPCQAAALLPSILFSVTATSLTYCCLVLAAKFI